MWYYSRAELIWPVGLKFKVRVTFVTWENVIVGECHLFNLGFPGIVLLDSAQKQVQRPANENIIIFDIKLLKIVRLHSGFKWTKSILFVQQDNCTSNVDSNNVTNSVSSGSPRELYLKNYIYRKKVKTFPFSIFYL